MIVSIPASLVLVGTFIGYLLVVLVSFIGLRLLYTFYSFFFHWSRYQQLQPVTTDDLTRFAQLPFVKFQITTRGQPGSTPLIKRTIQYLVLLAQEKPELYGSQLSVEVVTESWEQKHVIDYAFARAPLKVKAFVVPAQYETPHGTQLRARELHYIVELRRRGLHSKPGRTFIVHLDEDNIMLPAEVKKLLYHLAITPKRLLIGPVQYALRYRDADPLSQAMEAHRPIGGFVQATQIAWGLPLHLYSSNIVVDEQLENELGWDFSTLDGQPFVTEDFLFGLIAYCAYGHTIFGWHGCVLLAQLSSSTQHTLYQRTRWTTGILQGISALQRIPNFPQLPIKVRLQCIGVTYYHLFTAALGLPVSLCAIFYVCYQAVILLFGQSYLLPFPWTLWLAIVSFLWLNILLIGAWYNLSSLKKLSFFQRLIEILSVVTLAPLASMLESVAVWRALMRWLRGNRTIAHITRTSTPRAYTKIKVMRGRERA